MACLGYRACLGLLNLSKTYGEERLEAACRRALAIGSPTRIRIIAILKAKLDQHPDLFLAADAATATALRIRGNVRGADYFRVPSMSTDTETTDENTGSIWNTRSRSGGTAGHLQRNTQGQKFHEGVEHASFFLDIAYLKTQHGSCLSMALKPFAAAILISMRRWRMLTMTSTNLSIGRDK